MRNIIPAVRAVLRHVSGPTIYSCCAMFWAIRRPRLRQPLPRAHFRTDRIRGCRMPGAERFALTARLDQNPRYRGSSHDDAVARQLGYRAALIPGAFLYGHLTRLAVRRWGEDWLD